jgi:hypothetical protein
MRKKIMCLLVLGLVFALSIPMVSSYTTMETNKPASQLEITIKGGWGIHAFIKNIGTTDLNITSVEINLDGRWIIYGSQKSTPEILNIIAGKTKHLIFPVMGFGSTNIELTIDTTTQTASGKVLFNLVYGVK